jgi:hypothetical protein
MTPSTLSTVSQAWPRLLAAAGFLTYGVQEHDLAAGAASVALTIVSAALLLNRRRRRRTHMPWRARVLAVVLEPGRSPSLR